MSVWQKCSVGINVQSGKCLSGKSGQLQSIWSSMISKPIFSFLWQFLFPINHSFHPAGKNVQLVKCLCGKMFSWQKCLSGKVTSYNFCGNFWSQSNTFCHPAGKNVQLTKVTSYNPYDNRWFLNLFSLTLWQFLVPIKHFCQLGVIFFSYIILISRY